MADKAVLAGINDYRSAPDLRGCLSDVRNVERLLTEVFEFPAKNIRTLADAEVTKERIEAGWDWLLKGAKPGDRLVFHFSGHGSQNVAADTDADEPDTVDELICLHDMDWADDRTYLLDDDFRRFTERLPQGVALTILLDCCHSGTGTRLALAPDGRRSHSSEKAPFVDLRTSFARLGRGSTRSVELSLAEAGDLAARLTPRDREAVLVRYAPPPPEVAAALVRARVRSSPVRHRGGDEQMNHVLLAGCRSDQTSADAFIEDAFHGAFTFHLCETVRRYGSGIDHQTLIKGLRDGVRSGGFPQVPQLEPERSRGPFLGRKKAGLQPDRADGPAESGDAEENRPDIEAGAGMAELVRELRRLTAAIEGSLSPERRAVMLARGGDRHIVYVHGICRHERGYSDPWWNALARHLPEDLRAELVANRHEVLWSDLVTPEGRRERGLAAEELRPEERELADDIRDVLEDRRERQAVEALPEQPATQPTDRGLAEPRTLTDERALFGASVFDCVDDFPKYLLDDRIREAVIDRFRRVVLPLLSGGGTVFAICHSWGTVVAYEALREFDRLSLAGEVSDLFTAGSALSIPPVKRRLRPRDGRKPRCVRRWINLDAKGDIVGGPLDGRPFDVDHEYLNLKPVGCRELFSVYSPACAHGSYFDKDNIAVNRDIFARHMRD